MLKWMLFAFLGFTLVFDFFADRSEVHFWGDHIIGFWSIFALLGIILMIVISKGLSHVWLERDTDYYDK